jgi:Ni/Fe-hydrogenase subunit HybB-like protein
MANGSIAARPVHAPAPLGGRLATPITVVLGALALIAFAILVVRFVYGLGAVTNINDGYPWGIWISYDVVIGSALACGGYAMALLAYIFNRGEYHPMVRPALVASLFGYTLAGVSVILDLGRYWNFWHIFWPRFAQVNSVMFELAVCVTAYVLVMWIEFTPAFLERFGMHELRRKLNRTMFVFIGLGILLPTMHQSSLGSALVIFGPKLNPLWQTQLLPLLFLASAVAMGYSMVIFEACLSSVGFRRPAEIEILSKIAGVLVTVLVAYLVARFADVIWRGALALAFTEGIKSAMFWVENLLYAASIALLWKPAARRDPGRLFLAAVAMVLAGSVYRIDVYLVGLDMKPGWHYFPSLSELMVTIGLIAAEILGYIAFVRLLPVLPAAEAFAEASTDPGAGAARATAR